MLSRPWWAGEHPAIGRSKDSLARVWRAANRPSPSAQIGTDSSHLEDGGARFAHRSLRSLALVHHVTTAGTDLGGDLLDGLLGGSSRQAPKNGAAANTTPTSDERQGSHTMTKKNHTIGTPTPCQPWCDPRKHLVCGGPLCSPHVYEVKRSTRKPKKTFSRSGW